MVPYVPVRRIRYPVDIRKSCDRLVTVVEEALREDLLSGTRFVFVNRRGN